MENKEQSEFERGRQGAVTFAGLVYAGVVVAATTLFISFVLTAFPSDAYFSRFIMVIAGLLVGASTIAFPIALHNWTVTQPHRNITIGFYYGEMFIIALNTIVSFAALLFKYANIPLPQWVVWYEPFSIVSMIYIVIAWGTVFLTDPSAKDKANKHEAELENKRLAEEARREFDRRVAQKEKEFLDSIEGEDAIMNAASEKIKARYSAENYSSERRHFGSGKLPALDEQRVKMSDNGNKPKENNNSF